MNRGSEAIRRLAKAELGIRLKAGPVRAEADARQVVSRPRGALACLRRQDPRLVRDAIRRKIRQDACHAAENTLDVRGVALNGKGAVRDTDVCLETGRSIADRRRCKVLRKVDEPMGRERLVEPAGADHQAGDGRRPRTLVPQAADCTVIHDLELGQL
jgi:hypothetical protein